ncbi:MAG: chorismate mutase [Oscillospiraceae bacterium]|nr:chorismate mutase [Candidatus Equicaccousia limihippi]
MNLEELRKEIDLTDREIIKLLSNRFELAEKIGEYKQKNGIPVCDTLREEQILSRIKKEAEGYGEEITEIYKTLFTQSKKIQHK